MTTTTPEQTWVPRSVNVYDPSSGEWVPRPVRYHDPNRMAWVTGNLHLTGESAVTFPTLTAAPSSSVRSTFGVNAHLGWQWTPYVSNTATEDATYQTMIDLGVSYFREGYTAVGGDAQQNRMIPRLLAAGLKFYAGAFTYSLSAADTLAVINDMFTRYPDPGMFEAFAGVNEPDDVGVDWHAHTVEIQQTLWQAVRSRAAFNAIPVVSPALRSVKLTEIPEAGPFLDTIAIHHYPVAGKAFINASTGGETLDYKVDTYGAAFPGKPISVDEYGAFTPSSSLPPENTSAVPEEVLAVYQPRALCEATRRGMRLCIYELLDQFDETTATTGHFGLVDTTDGLTDPSVWRRKPSFVTLARLIALTRDDGPSFTPVPLQAVITGSTSPKTMVLSKRTGEHGVLHWRDVDVYNGTTKTATTVGPVAQTVTFPSPRSVELTDVTTGTTTTLGSVSSYTVSVAGNVIHARIGA